MALSDAERARRYRQRRAGQDVPKLRPGPRPGEGGRPRRSGRGKAWSADHTQEAIEGLREARWHLGFVTLDEIDDEGTREELARLLREIAAKAVRPLAK